MNNPVLKPTAAELDKTEWTQYLGDGDRLLQQGVGSVQGRVNGVE